MASKSASRVFVTQESTMLNYTPAEQFGEITFLTRDEVSQVSGSLMNAAIIDQLRNGLKHYNPATDYIAPSGSPVVTAIVFMLVGGLWGGKKVGIKILRWSNRDRVYQPIIIEV